MKETTRPTLYRIMKYWGKKPHNIWSSYIKKYSKRNDIILDPFVGSGMTYFEAIKAKRIPLTIDINPISDLCIECLSMRTIDCNEIKKIAKEIINKLKESECYKKEYICKCSNCINITDIYNYKINGKITISYKCNNCKNTITEVIDENVNNYKIINWVPNKKLSDLNSVSSTFIEKIGGNSISNLWTNRNLRLLSDLYAEILDVEEENYKKLLVFAFVQTLHLTSKMCIPRNEKSNRPLSTSWGRPAYMISDKIFEQNPILAFEKAVMNSTGVIKGLKSSEEYLGKYIPVSAKHILGNSYEILKKLDKESIDMAITDPPYGDIIQYGDLSEVWVSWLEYYKKEYSIDHDNEVIVNKKKNQGDYSNQLELIFKEVYRVLKQNSVFIITFNSNTNDDWKSLLRSIKNSGFYIDDVIYQKNRRSSEANVAAKEGIAISDYYFICKKGSWNTLKITDIIKERSIDL